MGKEEKKKMEQKDELTNSGQRFPVEQVSNTGKPTKKQVKAAVKELFSARRIRSEPQPSISSVSGRSARALLWLKAWREPILPRLCLIQ